MYLLAEQAANQETSFRAMSKAALQELRQISAPRFKFLYFYDTGDLLKTCDELLNEEAKNPYPPTISGDKVSFVYMATYGDATDIIYCDEFSASDPSLADDISVETYTCNNSAQESDELVQISCIMGTGCPAPAKKVCSISKNALTYLYEDGDESMPCPCGDY